MFKDEVKIFVKGGHGGKGCVSFRHEKYVAEGGPDGGDGGKGGDVIIIADLNLNTLYEIGQRKEYLGKDGQAGRGKNRHGRNGQDVEIKVPCGTIIYDARRGNILRDLKKDGDRFVIAMGGKGGHGNKFFASSTNQTPREYQKGEEGEARNIRLELKLIADVGLIGLPNAGKSTLLSRISSARPKIAEYPFTTLIPNLGIVAGSDLKSFVVADIPGLIEGAHEGAGLGDKFLRHIERTKILVHLIDIAPYSKKRPSESYEIIRNELKEYSEKLAKKIEIVVANKMDLPEAEENLNGLRSKLSKKIFPISALTGQGIDELLKIIYERVFCESEGAVIQNG